MVRARLAVGALCGASALIASAAPAAAEPCYEDWCRDTRERSWDRPRFEGAVGMLAGGFGVANVSGGAIGMHVDAGVRIGRIALLGEYALVSIGESTYEVEDPIRGELHRLGGHARYSVATIAGEEHHPLRGDVWIEGGVGAQRVVWNGGGELGRRDLSFGVGGQLTGRIGRHRPHDVGLYYAFRGLVARDPNGGRGEPTCAGPCDMATGPSPWDVGAFFNFGVTFSR